MSKIFRQYNSSEEVVMIPDTPAPPLRDSAFDIPVMHSAESAEALAAQIVRQARAEAEDAKRKVLELAQSERREMLRQAAQDAQELRDRAHEEGYAQGAAEKRADVAECLQGVQAAIASLCEEHRSFIEEYERELKFFAADIAQKLIERKIAEDDTILTGLVRHAVQSVREADWISVEVSVNLTRLVSLLERELGGEINGMRLEIAPRDLPDDSCVVQTSEGVIDASVSTQVRNLKAIFRDMDRENE